MISLSDIIRAIKNNQERLVNFGVYSLELFGSVNNETQTETSYMNLKFFLEDLFNSKIDLVIKSSLRQELVPFIHGRVLYAESV